MRLRLKVLVGILVTLILANGIWVIYNIRKEIQINKEDITIQIQSRYEYLDREIDKLKKQNKDLKITDKLIYYQIDKLKKQNKDLKITDKLIYYQIDKNYSELNDKITNLLKIERLNKERVEKMILNSSVIVYSIRELGMGSGTIIKKTEDAMYVLTCYHVINNYYTEENVLPMEKITISYDNIIYAVDIIKADENYDLALLKVYFNDSALEEIKLAKNYPKKGDIVYTVGNPLGSMRHISSGILSNEIDFDENDYRKKFYISDALTVFGNSGGGLYNENGELIGVPSNVPSYGLGGAVVTNMGMCIVLDNIKEFLKDVI
jgi:S1-C subfamily serine protease